jgi:5'(3')-deoxyribonucleotidase
MPRALVDCDGVLSDFVSLALDYINKEQNTSYTPADLERLGWDFFHSITTPEIERKFWNAVHDTPGMVLSMNVYAGAIEGIRALREVADVVVVTAPHHSRHWAYERSLWLMQHFDIDPKHVIHTHQKQFCRGDVLVDDRPQHISDWTEHHPGGHGILWAQPYNVDAGYFYRTSSWEDVCQIVIESQHGAPTSRLRTQPTENARGQILTLTHLPMVFEQGDWDYRRCQGACYQGRSERPCHPCAPR